MKAMNKALHDAVDTRNALFGGSQGEAGEVLIEWDGARPLVGLCKGAFRDAMREMQMEKRFPEEWGMGKDYHAPSIHRGDRRKLGQRSPLDLRLVKGPGPPAAC